MRVNTKIKDDGLKEAVRQGKKASKATASAISSAGYALRNSIKKGVAEEAPGGERWPRTHPWTKYGLLRKSMNRMKRAKGKGKKLRKVKRVSIGGKAKTPLRKLANASRYRKYVNERNTRVQIGFLNPGLQKRAEYHAEGKTVAVTPKMRRFIFASGLIAGKRITIPKREIVDPVYEANKAKIPRFVRLRVAAALAGRNPRSIEPRFK